MKTDRIAKALLTVIAVLLFMNFLCSAFPVGPANAVKGNEEIGRYQVASWAAQSGAYTHHSGYYIIDTITGKVIDSKAEVHSSEK